MLFTDFFPYGEIHGDNVIQLETHVEVHVDTPFVIDQTYETSIDVSY